MIKKNLWSLGLTLTLVACGGSSSSDPTPVEEKTPETPPTEETAPVSYGDVPIYLRGDMNSWAMADDWQMTFREETGCYGLTAAIPLADNEHPAGSNAEPAEHRFKIASEMWDKVNIGGYGVADSASLIDRSKSTVILGEALMVNARIALPEDNLADIVALPDPRELILPAAEEAERTFTLCFPTHDAGQPELTVK